MEVIISAIISAIVALITAFISVNVKLAKEYKNDVKRHILKERTSFYMDMFPVIDKLVSYPEKVFNKEYMEEFYSYKATMKLLGSENTFKQYVELFQYVNNIRNLYDVFDGYKHGEDEKHFEKTYWEKLSEEDLALSYEEFEEKHKPDKDHIGELVENLYTGMREDLGSIIK